MNKKDKRENIKELGIALELIEQIEGLQYRLERALKRAGLPNETGPLEDAICDLGGQIEMERDELEQAE